MDNEKRAHIAELTELRRLVPSVCQREALDAAIAAIAALAVSQPAMSYGTKLPDGADLFLVSPSQATALWVSVDDRLPTAEDYGEHGDVLVRYRYTDRPYVEWLIGDSVHDADEMPGWNNGWQFGSCDYVEVSHWARKDDLLALIDMDRQKKESNNG